MSDQVGTQWYEADDEGPAPLGGKMGAKARTAQVFSSRRREPVASAAPEPQMGGRMAAHAARNRRMQELWSPERREEASRAKAEQAQDRRVMQDIQRDMTAAFQGNADEVRDWKTVAEIAIGLANQDDEEARGALNHLMWNYQDQLRQHTDTLVGEEFWDDNFEEMPEPGLFSRTLGSIGDFFDWAESGGASARRAIAAAKLALMDDDKVQGISDAELVRESIRQGARAIDFTRLIPGYGGITESIDENARTGEAGLIYGERGQAIDLDLDDDGRLSFMEALNRTTKGDESTDTAKFFGGDLLANVAAFAGEALFDPVNHLSAGTPALARNGSRAFVAQANKEGWGPAAREIMQRASEKGLRKLPTAERELVEATLKRAVADVPQARRMQIPGRSRALPERQVRAMEQGLQSGFKVGGTTILPSHTITRGTLKKATGKSWKGRRVYEVVGNDTIEDLRRLDEAVQDGEPVEDLVKKVLYRGYEQGWADQLIDLPGLGRVIRSMKPRAMTRALHGEEAAKQVERVLARSRAATSTMPELNNGLLRVKVNPKHREVLDTLDSDGLEGLLRTGDAGGPEFQLLLEDVDEIKAATRVALVGARATPEDLARLDEWFPRVAATALMDGVEGGGNLSGRVVGQARRSTLDDLVRSGDDVPLAYASRDDIPAGDAAEYVSYRADGLEFFVDKTVLEDIRELDSVLASPAQKGKVAKAFDQMNNVWGALATAMAPNPAFIARNAGGNFFLMALGGFSTPMSLLQSASMMRTHHRVIRAAAANEITMKQALEGLAGGMSDDVFRTLNTAYDQGVLGNMGRQLDIVQESAGVLNPVGSNRLSRFTDKAQDPNGMWYRATFGPSQTIEDHARLSLYLDQVAKGADPDTAAGHVAKYLFDYGDTTDFERGTIRRASRFYTFLRKNTALQAEMIGREPGRLLALQGIVDDAEDSLVRDEDGSIQPPPWLPQGAGGLLGGMAVGLNIETPLDAALDAAEPLRVVARELANYSDPASAIEDRIAGRETGSAALVDSLVGLTSGFGPAVATFVQESQTGRDSFTGRRLDPDGKLRDRAWFRFVDTLIPAAGRAERTIRTAQDDETYGAQAKLLKLLAGVQVYGTDTADEAGERQAENVYRAIDELRDELVADGHDVPTINELREDGIYGARDRLAEALMYSWEKNDDGTVSWDEQVRDDRVLSIIPKKIRQAFQLPEPEGSGLGRGPIPEAEEGSDLWAEQVEAEATNIREALELWLGRPLDDQEALDILIMMPGGPTNAELREAGIDPGRTSNRFLPEREEEERASAERRLEVYAQAVGLDSGALADMRPRLSRIEQVIVEAEEAGVPRDQLLKYITTSKDEGGGGVLSRKDRALFNQLYNTAPGSGIIDLSTTRFPEFTDEDAERAWNKAWESEMELRLVAELYGLPAPTGEQLRDYVLNAQLSGAELEITGDTRLDNAPTRKDIRPDEVKAQQAFAERRAALSAVGSQGRGNPFVDRQS